MLLKTVLACLGMALCAPAWAADSQGSLTPSGGGVGAAQPWRRTDISVKPASRVVTLGGSVTEIVYRLGQENRLVGDDISSQYPEAATRLPRVGYYRQAPVEGILALKPDLVLASEQAGPPETLQRLQALGLPVRKVSDAHSVDSLKTRIREVAGALGVPDEGESLAAEVTRDLDQALALPAARARTLFLVNRTGALQGAGRDTSADEILRLAGLTNVLDGQRGYKPLSAEAAGALAPQLIVTSSASLQASGGVDALLAQPGLAATPAAKCRCVVAMDDLLILGMGPRLPQALTQLKQEAARVLPR